MTVSTLLFWLVLVCLLPEVLGSGFLIYHEYQEERAQLVKNMGQSVRNKMQVVDVDLEQLALFTQVLGTSSALHRQDWPEFHRRALQLVPNASHDLTVALFDKTGQQLLNSKIPWGRPLLKRLDQAALRSVFAADHTDSHKPLAHATDGPPVVRTLAPVFAGQKVIYALVLDFSPDKFSRILNQYGLDDGVITTIVDSTGTIAARSHEPAQFIGQKVASEIGAQFQKAPEGAFDFIGENGTPLHASYSSSSRTGWRVLMVAPVNNLDAAMQRAFALMGQGSFLVLILSMGFAWFVSKRITQSVSALKASVIALGTGQQLPSLSASLRETYEVGQSLTLTARQLETRTNELLHANTSLKERSTELAEAQHIARIGHWTWDFQTNRRTLSEELIRQFGPRALNPLDRQADTIFPPGAWQKLDDAIKETVRTGVGYALELQVLNKEGVLIWVDVRGVAVFGGSGEVTGLRGTMQDISKFKETETSLFENKTRLKMALSSSDLALWDWHIQSDDLFFDARWAAIQGYKKNELPTRIDRYMQGVFPEDVPLIYKNLEAHYQDDEKKYEAIYRVLHKDGHYVWIQGTGRVVERDAQGQPLRMLGVALDITERKHHESMMEALHGEMDAMLVWQVAQHTVAALAHEVNQPLASLAILSEVANRFLVSDRDINGDRGEFSKRCEETLRRMNAEIERAASVVKNLLVSVNKPDITRTPTVVNELVAESIQTALLEGVFGYQITTDHAADLPCVKVNRLQVSKVLLNLVHNAAQAMHAAQMVNGKIAVRTALAADGSAIEITVQDDGPGISALMQQEVFQPFISSKSHGLGLGLPISRALIEAHNGKLWATQVEGRGATFHFTLPILD